MAVRAMEYVTSPSLAQPTDVGENVFETCGDQ